MEKFPFNQPLMVGLLRVDFINHSVNAPDKESLISEMVDLAERTALLLDKKALWESLLARESDGSTAYSGCALLHPRVPTPELVSSSFMVLGRSRHAIEFDALDRLAVDIFFAICCKDPVTQIKVLGRLTNMILRTRLLGQLRHAADARGMFESLIGCEQAVMKC